MNMVYFLLLVGCAPCSSRFILFRPIFFNRTTKLENINTNNATNYMRRKEKVVFLVHGWTQNYTRPWIQVLKNVLFERRIDHVIAVDYSKIASQNYVAATKDMPLVGAKMACFIVSLHKSGFNLKNIHLIGHSLGGQVIGFAGKYVTNETSKKIARITALDPAPPLANNDTKRLALDDAIVVFVIHTDNTLGYENPSGTIDIYPNGGKIQPGCSTLDRLCSHHKSHEYFTYAVKNPGTIFMSQCTSYEEFESGKCNRSLTVDLGDLKLRASGKFYLTTTAEEPYRLRP